ncbi:hypothetical protein M422DRAFT_254696 [Sphaerobolus stellatus SS14]|uniref:Uncharacterized protein n=1 Tax=Sphaerobolus stellatus (strain SS14) TaxID=990650 RepID=A0A0C9VVH3_SPHS4|nr:hypothetical protein M422DRAFT_254696 [Sphaerobolus stellatus SS14]
MGFTAASLQDCSNILGALSSTAPSTTILSISTTVHHYDAIPTAKYRSRRLEQMRTSGRRVELWGMDGDVDAAPATGSFDGGISGGNERTTATICLGMLQRQLESVEMPQIAAIYTYPDNEASRPRHTSSTQHSALGPST